MNLKARDKGDIEQKLFDKKWPITVIIKAGSMEGGINPKNFLSYKKLVFNISNGKLVGKRMLDEDLWEDLEIYQVP